MSGPARGHRTSLVALTQAADIEGRGADVVDMKLEVVVLAPLGDAVRSPATDGGNDELKQ
jgi:hypothetical protein